MSENRPINRRSFLARVGGVALLAGGAMSLVSTTEAQAITDRDPSDPVGRGRGRRRYRCTDRDPYDPVGRGRRCRSGPRRRYTGITDRDPRDPAGYGRGRRRRRITDNDPTDPVGRGRG
jgi:hypothetical protein